MTARNKISGPGDGGGRDHAHGAPAGARAEDRFDEHLERLHREVKGRCNVVGIFPNARSALRLIGAVLEEQGDEWLAVRHSFSVGSMAVLYGSSPEELEVLPLEVRKEVISV